MIPSVFGPGGARVRQRPEVSPVGHHTRSHRAAMAGNRTGVLFYLFLTEIQSLSFR